MIFRSIDQKLAYLDNTATAVGGLAIQDERVGRCEVLGGDQQEAHEVVRFGHHNRLIPVHEFPNTNRAAAFDQSTLAKMLEVGAPCLNAFRERCSMNEDEEPIHAPSLTERRQA